MTMATINLLQMVHDGLLRAMHSSLPENNTDVTVAVIFVGTVGAAVILFGIFRCAQYAVSVTFAKEPKKAVWETTAVIKEAWTLKKQRATDRATVRAMRTQLHQSEGGSLGVQESGISADFGMFDISDSITLPVVHSVLDDEPLKTLTFTCPFAVIVEEEIKHCRWLTLREAAELNMPECCFPLKEQEMLDNIKTGQSMTRDTASFIERIPAPWSPQSVRETLKAYDIDISAWEPYQLESLAMEFATGRSFLVCTGDECAQVRRTMDIVSVIIVYPVAGKALIMDSARSNTIECQDEAISAEVAPSVRKLPYETVVEAAHRCIREKFEGLETSIELRCSKVKAVDEEETSESYPGLTMIKRRRIVQGFLSAGKAREFGLSSPTNLMSPRGGAQSNQSKFQETFETRHDATTYHWVWKDIEQVSAFAKLKSWLDLGDPLGRKRGDNTKLSQRMLRMRTTRDLRGSGRKQDSDSETLQVIQPWTAAAVEKLLKEHRMSAANYGLTVDELAALVSTSSAYFGRRRTDDKLVFVTDTVELRIVSPNGQAVLAEIDSENGEQWLRSKQRLDETAWDAARRIASAQLGLEDDAVHMYYKPLEIMSTNLHFATHENPVLEGSPASSQQAWMGVSNSLSGERRWLITAHIKEQNINLCSNLHASDLYPEA
eukprot:gnl/MRDRNA2_/MRDRNA2_33249_c0_seq2.p1 gnl/MRDRNA2_/MRDRNA2_33249_c0~~gnl/MRDRNA2_/MRDRNA2_33249_c0_seq2.p1  ORF type:complete len:662 (-),score=113.54 gnl/MRDRNA2_/MRDRNA2_33249_c0_seq2:21-2006(-)